MTSFHTTGKCLCGSVRIAADVDESVGACHCDICRTWGGGPLLALNGGTGLEISGEENVSSFASTAWAERAFCSRCGTHLYIRVNASGRYIIPAGLFPLDQGMNFDHQIFIDKRPSYYCFANETRDLTGEQVFGQMNQGDS